ncbi:MAG TPA: type II secretion system F family protein [Acidobacteriaceae bacterium]|nr:type II secretion system F family protein [Acidobacteriaceae bacterium]
MHSLFYIALAVAFFSAGALVFLSSSWKRSRFVMQRVLEATQGSSRFEQARPRFGEMAKRLLALTSRLLSTVGIAESAALRERLMRAGFRGPSAFEIYLAARVLGPAVALFAGSFSPAKPVFWMMALPGIAYLAPDIVLQRMGKRRRERIRLSIPDAIDLLVICVDAGLGIDQAMLRVGQELGVSHPEITEEFLQINREQRAGRLRIDAWQAMAERNNLPDLAAFVNMLTQTERFGTPIARALSSFADNIRLKRRQQAEEQAAKTTVKIIFPLVICIFPSLFIVLLGPAVLTIIHGLSKGFR